MLVFRDGSECVDADGLKRSLLDIFRGGSREPLPLLLKWGEIESALEDAGVTGLERAREFTLRLARDCLVPNAAVDEHALRTVLDSLAWPRLLVTKKPEGYCYYALNPMNYARAVRQVDTRATRLVVIGVRNIGTSLSALVSASFERQGAQVLRVTVRPGGPAWERKLAIADDVVDAIRSFRPVTFFVVDEGPGLSGATFLAVGESLIELGVQPAAINFVCSHEPDVDSLVARDAARRWRRFRTIVAEGDAARSGTVDLSAGKWRRVKYSRDQLWPASWPELERRKFLHVREQIVSRFIGYPPYDEPVENCAALLGDAGFAPIATKHAPGYMAQAWLDAEPCSSDDAPHALPQLADYLAFRVRNCSGSPLDAKELERMAQINIHEALGLECDIRLETVRGVRADAHMMPHEWLALPSGKLVKTDGHDHGDDHLFPGPCDIAWDIAGTIVEWSLDAAEVSALTSRYSRMSGDRVLQRLPAYLIAYAAFRLGYARMAMLSAHNCERGRLVRLSQYYESELLRLLLESGVARRSSKYPRIAEKRAT